MSLPWNQIHAKVAAAFGSGAVATFVLWIFSSQGWSPPPELASAIASVVALIGGYLTPTPASQSRQVLSTTLPPTPPPTS